MALNAATLGVALKAEIKAQMQAKLTIEDLAQLDKVADALATAIAAKVVEHIKSAAQVSVTTTCGAGAGSGSGSVA